MPKYDKPGDTIGIALSGGGSRAALYSLGVLLYFVHSKLNNRVRLISSVSGGSIINAALSLTKDYSRLSPRDFDEIAGKLAHRLANKGVFFFPGWRWFMRTALTACGLAILIIAIPPLFITQGLPVDYLQYTATPLLLGVIMGSVYSLASYWFRRRGQQMAAHSRLIADFQHKEKGVKQRSSLKLSDSNDKTRVRHVLCATELTSGRPIYMDRREIRSPAYGSGEANLSLVKAIYASAAFPVGFPPLRVKTASLNMSGGDTEERPPWLFLSDGGVFNNLGTDSFTAWTTWDPFMPDRRFTNWPWPAIAQRIVVNASSPSRLAKVPRLWIWRNIVTIQRIMAVLYENTLRPRIQTLLAEEERPGGPIVIDIANSPIAILERQIGNKDWGMMTRISVRKICSISSEDFRIQLIGTSTLFAPLALRQSCEPLVR
jgi:predicted acylesterase/phospholipase RssA